MADLFADTAASRPGPALPWWVCPTLALATSAVIALATRGGPTVVAVTGLAAAGALVAAAGGDRHRRRWAAPAGAVALAAALAVASATGGGPLRTVTFAVVAIAVAAGTAVVAGHGGPPWVTWPWLAATAGLYLTLPDTEGARALAAGLLVAALVSLVARRWRDGMPGRWPQPPVMLGAAVWSVPVAWVAGHDADGRLPPRIAALAAAGVLVAWPVARLLLACRPGPPRLGWGSLTLVQVPAAVVVARLGGVRVGTTRAVITSTSVLLVLVAGLAAAEWLLHRSRRAAAP